MKPDSFRTIVWLALVIVAGALAAWIVVAKGRTRRQVLADEERMEAVIAELGPEYSAVNAVVTTHPKVLLRGTVPSEEHRRKLHDRIKQIHGAEKALQIMLNVKVQPPVESSEEMERIIENVREISEKINRGEGTVTMGMHIREEERKAEESARTKQTGEPTQ